MATKASEKSPVDTRVGEKLRPPVESPHIEEIPDQIC